MTDSPYTLARIRLFKGLSPQVLATLGANLVERRYSEGQIIFVEDEPNAPVFFVVEGQVQVSRSCPEGREQTMMRIGPGEAFYLPCAFASSHEAPATSVALGEVCLLAVAPDAFRRITAETPALALAVLGDLSDKLRHMVCLARDLSLRSVRARLAQFLLEESARRQGDTIRWTHAQIAARIGSVREVVGRLLRELIAEGLISMQRQRILVLDREGLRQRSE